MDLNDAQISDHNYFDHDADIGIIGVGDTLEASFIQAAKALFALMTDLTAVRPEITMPIKFEESDVELALVTWLNTLIATAQAEHLVFSEFQLQRQGDTWYGEARGEVWREALERRIDVKGATLTLLSVKQTDQQWEAKCVVDV